MSTAGKVASLAEALQASAWLSDTVHPLLGDKADVTYVQRLSIAYLSLSLDHREALLLLVQSGARSSAMALARSQLEAYVLGLWVELFVDNEVLKQIKNGARKSLPKFETALKQVLASHVLGKWLGPLRNHYSTLSDYAHGQLRQITRWLTHEGVKPTHSDEQMVELLEFSDSLAMLACMSREDMMQRSIAPFTQLHRMIRMRVYYDESARRSFRPDRGEDLLPSSQVAPG